MLWTISHPSRYIPELEGLFKLKLPGWEKRYHVNKYFGSDKTAYNRLYSKNAQWFKMNDLEIRDVMKSLISSGSIQKFDSILDLGCGHARTLARLSYDLQHSSEVMLIGLDFSLEGLKLAVKHNKYNNSTVYLNCADMTNTPFRDKSFKLIISNGSHEHLEKPNFREVRRIIKDDGLFLCLLPFVPIHEPEMAWTIKNVQRENIFWKQSWIRILEKDKFNVEVVNRVFICRPHN